MPKDIFNLFVDDNKDVDDLNSIQSYNLDSLASTEEEQKLLIEKVDNLQEVNLKVDYSNFSNFVFFNSAEDYFTITGNKILSEYPFDGTVDEIEKFVKSLDEYQRYIVSVWPKSVGYLSFNSDISSSFMSVDDVGFDKNSKTYRSSLFSPNTGSFSLECWVNPEKALTGSNDAIFIAQKISGSNQDGFSLFLSASSLFFRVKSGSITNEISSPITYGKNNFVSAVFDKTSYTGSIYIATGSSGDFPVIVNSSSLTIFNSINLSNSKFFIGSGTLVGKNTHFLSGNLDEVKFWKKNRTIEELTSSFNVKQNAQTNLIAHYRFNESGSSIENEDNKIVLDYAGSKLNGRIQNYYPDMRVSGTLLIEEFPDLILKYENKEVSSYVEEQILSGSVFDKNNINSLISKFPSAFLKLDQETDVLKNFVFLIGRFFDKIKLNIDQFENILSVNYGKFNQTPDEILDIVADYFGWKFSGNFLNADAFQYLLGKNVLTNVETNKSLEKKLFNIKNEFWKRTLLNLMYIYKSKGTRESVKALMRIYGLDENFVRLKEFGVTEKVSLETQRIFSEKSVPVLGFGSGSFTGSVKVDFVGPETSFSVESQVLFPLTSSANITASFLSGNIWSMIGDGNYITLSYEKNSVGSHTGTLILSSSDQNNILTVDNIGIFDGKWNNLFVVYNSQSSSLEVNVKKLNENIIGSEFSSSLTNVTGGIVINTDWNEFVFGSTSSLQDVEFWASEVRVWDNILTKDDMEDHTLNFQSYGIHNSVNNYNDLLLNWKFIDNTVSNNVIDVSTNNNNGNRNGFFPSQNPYKKFLREYNYIASPDFGWSDNKIRSFSTSKLDASQDYKDENILSLEFNLIDSLNEDIVQIFNSIEFLNESVGFPGNKYRVAYDDLELLRENYFKRLKGKINFNIFIKMLDFFDRNFLKTIKQIIPAKAKFLGDEFVVQSHMLERSKIVYERRKEGTERFEPQGLLKVWRRF